jgi:hypothetical protein
MTISSCAYLLGKEFGDAYYAHLETGKEDGVVGYYYRIYVENKTDETIVIFYRDGSRIGNVKKNKTKQFNVYKNRYIYIIGNKSQKQYFLVMCGTDREVFIIQ